MKNNKKFDKITIGDNMDNRIIKYIVSIPLCVILMVVELLLLVQYNTSKGIRKEDVLNIINNIDIVEQIEDQEEYRELENILGNAALKEIINSDEVSSYIRESAKRIYLNTVHGERNISLSKQELTEYIEKKAVSLQELDKLSEKNKREVIRLFNEIADKMANDINETANFSANTNIIPNLISKKTTTYLILGVVFLSALIMLVNQNKNGLLFPGITTLIVGTLFFILHLSLTRKINATGIDDEIIELIKDYLPNLVRTLRKSSLMMMIIGGIECGLYTVLNYQEMGNKDGEI